jgi:hypothetical protein
MKLSQKIYRLIDIYFDDPINFKEMYSVKLIKTLAETFSCSEDAGIKMIKQYYKERPTLRSFAYNYENFLNYVKDYEKKLNHAKPTEKLMIKILEEVNKPDPEKDDLYRERLLFLYDYFSYKYFKR